MAHDLDAPIWDFAVPLGIHRLIRILKFTRSANFRSDPRVTSSALMGAAKPPSAKRRCGLRATGWDWRSPSKAIDRPGGIRDKED